MSTLQKYAESSNADLRAEAVINTLQIKYLRKLTAKRERTGNTRVKTKQ